MRNVLENFVLFEPSLDRKVIFSLLILIGLFSINRIISYFAERNLDDIKMSYLVRKTSNYIIFFLGFFSISRIWFQGVQSLATFLGLASAGLAIALKDYIMDIGSWCYIMVKRPFVVGDRIEIGGSKGDVIDIGLFKISLLEIGEWVDADQSTGRILHIPTATFLTGNLVNYHAVFPFIWNEINVLLTFESDWRLAKKLFYDLLLEKTNPNESYIKQCMTHARKHHMVYFKNIDPTIYVAVKESGVQLSLRFLCSPKKRRAFDHELWEGLLTIIESQESIDLGYSTVRFYTKS
ncbi:mechanosensitive ion channel protein MscS [Candidatus Marinamargulisbacteria bacterium SCGC AG-343-D04]|nr:mechanosensitive ion channel protein MscS [Candidatus Marinamargulisbacteria bacterium SCGC AG-343-D04]